MQETLKFDNYEELIGKVVGDWNIVDSANMPGNYVIALEKDSKNLVFFVRKEPIKELGKSLGLYELWFRDYEDSIILSEADATNCDTIINNMRILLNRYSKHIK